MKNRMRPGRHGRHKGDARSLLQMAEDRRRIAEMYLQGDYQASIAAKLGRPVSSVASDIRAIQRQWELEAVEYMRQAKLLELKKIDRIERESWEAWERSKVDRERRAVKDIDGRFPRSEQQIVSEGQVGDPRFLEKVQWCIERRCKLLGLDSPTIHVVAETQVEQIVGNQPKGVDQEALRAMASEDRRKKMIQLMQRLGGASIFQPPVDENLEDADAIDVEGEVIESSLELTSEALSIPAPEASGGR